VGEADLVRRRVALLCVGALLGIAGAGCGSDDVDRDVARLRDADAALQDDPRDRFAMAEVIRAATAAAGNRVDTQGGNYEPSARRFLNRADQVWPRYVRATGARPDAAIASLMIAVYGNGLNRPADAARAAEFVALDRPSAAAYVSLADWASRAGDRRKAKLAGQKALELAEPGERARVRAAIRVITHGRS
jgi:hypothetical protein